MRELMLWVCVNTGGKQWLLAVSTISYVTVDCAIINQEWLFTLAVLPTAANQFNFLIALVTQSRVVLKWHIFLLNSEIISFLLMFNLIFAAQGKPIIWILNVHPNVRKKVEKPTTLCVPSEIFAFGNATIHALQWVQNSAHSCYWSITKSSLILYYSVSKFPAIVNVYL